MEESKREAKEAIGNAMVWRPSNVNGCLEALIMGESVQADKDEIERLRAKKAAYEAGVDAALDEKGIEAITASVRRK